MQQKIFFFIEECITKIFTYLRGFFFYYFFFVETQTKKQHFHILEGKQNEIFENVLNVITLTADKTFFLFNKSTNKSLISVHYLFTIYVCLFLRFET